jgi:2-methylisocitrate lyase-like PEP mutase family enzyme
MVSLKNLAQKAEELLKLHQGPRILVFPNVWDVASAKLVERAGFPAIATSSAAIAFALGYPDGQRIRREEMLAAVARIAAHVSLPVTADLEAGYGANLEEIARTADGLLAAGAVGLNFEDGTGNHAKPLADIADQVARIRTLREIGERAVVHIVINARTDVFLDQVGEPASRFDEAVHRANAYREAGGDCLFIPGVQDAETIGKLVMAVHGPINILAGPATPAIPELEGLGVRRVSFGSWPMRAAMTHFDRFVKELAQHGTFRTLGNDAMPFAEMNKFFDGAASRQR